MLYGSRDGHSYNDVDFRKLLSEKSIQMIAIQKNCTEFMTQQGINKNNIKIKLYKKNSMERKVLLTLAAPGFFGLVLPRGEGRGAMCLPHHPPSPPPAFLNSGRVELWIWNLAQWYSVMLQIKWHKKISNMVTSVMMTLLIIRTLAQNYAKKCKNGTLSKIEIVRVRKKIFDLSFQFLKAKRSWKKNM